MLKSLLMVWIMAFDLAHTEQAYKDFFGYTLGERGIITNELALQMSRPDLSGARYTTLYPPSGPRVGLRFIEGPQTDYYPMRHLGWNAVEILVADPKTLKVKLDSSPFKRLAGPDFLTPAQNILALQALGPSNELLYLTHIIDPTTSFLVIPHTPTPVGHTFIMVLGTSDLSVSMSFFEHHFVNPVKGPLPFKVEVLSNTYQLPIDHLHDLGLVTFSDGFALELDQYPATALPLPAEPNLSGGVVMVTASYDPSFIKAPLQWKSISETLDSRTQSLTGIIELPSGALMQLIPETSPLTASKKLN